jgi:hypothetical protein
VRRDPWGVTLLKDEVRQEDNRTDNERRWARMQSAVSEWGEETPSGPEILRR